MHIKQNNLALIGEKGLFFLKTCCILSPLTILLPMHVFKLSIFEVLAPKLVFFGDFRVFDLFILDQMDGTGIGAWVGLGSPDAREKMKKKVFWAEKSI